MIHARLASLPEREKSLERTIASLRPQVDSIFVVLNNYTSPPSFLKNGEWVIRQNENGAASKFMNAEHLNGYIFICDDDLQYPPGYVRYMIRGIEEYKAVVTLHGKSYKPGFKDFRDWDEVYRCLGNVDRDVRVQIPGTGVMAYHSSLITISEQDIALPFGVDVSVGKICHERNVPVYCLMHTSSYLSHTIRSHTLFKSEGKKGFKDRNELLKTFIK